MNNRTLNIFMTGLGICLVGTGLLWVGDGHNDLIRKGLVISGVALTVVGIGVLRYLLISGFRRSK